MDSTQIETITIQCHRPGGYALPGVILKHGRNEVEAEAWRSAIAAINPKIVDALLHSDTPDLVVHKPESTQQALPLEAEPDEPQEMLAKEKIALVEAATEPDELERLADGETRKTVLAAIHKRAKVLAEAA
jgi:hypothetical protein